MTALILLYGAGAASLNAAKSVAGELRKTKPDTKVQIREAALLRDDTVEACDEVRGTKNCIEHVRGYYDNVLDLFDGLTDPEVEAEAQAKAEAEAQAQAEAEAQVQDPAPKTKQRRTRRCK